MDSLEALIKNTRKKLQISILNLEVTMQSVFTFHDTIDKNGMDMTLDTIKKIQLKIMVLQ